jgi:hypothetical protein
MVYVDPLAIFDNVGVLIDAVMGEQGVWKDVLDGLQEDIHGPKINIRDELVANLGNRVLGMSRYEKPITVNSESMVVAVELKPGKEPAMLAGVEKLLGTDPEWMSTQHKTYKIWHRIPADDVVWVQIDPVFPGGLVDEPVEAVRGQQPDDEDEDRPPLFPEAGVVVAKGCLFVSSDIEYLKVILDRLDAPAESAGTTIRNEAEYLAVDKIFVGMGLTNKPHFFQFFARTQETLRPTYEMVRKGQMAQSQALLGKILNMVLSPDEESGERQQILDGNTLPEFEKVQRYFGKVGIVGTSEDNGYFIKGFSVE